VRVRIYVYVCVSVCTCAHVDTERFKNAPPVAAALLAGACCGLYAGYVLYADVRTWILQ